MPTDTPDDSWPSPAFQRAMELAEQGEHAHALTRLRAELPNRAGIERAECLRWIAGSEAQLDALDAAVEALEQAVSLLADEPFSELAVDCALLAGTGLAELNRDAEAVPYLRTAAAGLRVLAEYYGDGIEDPEWIGEIADCDEALATALAETGDFAAALPVFRSAAIGFAAAGRIADAAESRSDCGAMAVELDDAELVRDEFDAARRVFDELGETTDSAHCSYMIGIAYSELADTDRALTELQRARTGFAGAGRDVSVADCDVVLSEVYATQDRIDDAITAMTTAAAAYDRHGEREQCLDCHRKLAELHLNRTMRHLRSGRNQAAIAEIAATREACEAFGDPDLVAELDVLVGMVLDDLDHPDAGAAYTRARAHYLRTGRELEVAWCDAQLATSLLGSGDVAAAERELIRVCAIFEKAGDQARLAKCRRFLANGAVRRSAYDEALRLLESAYEYAREAGDEELRAECCQDIGDVLVQIGEYHEAITRLAESTRTFDSLSELMKAAAGRERAAVANFYLGRHAAAEDLFFEARTVFAHVGAPRWVAGVDMELGLIYCTTGRFEESERAYRDALDNFGALGLNEDRARAQANLGGLYLRRGDYEDAALAYEAAEATFQRSGQKYQAAVCRENLGAIAIMRGDSEAGRNMTDSARAYFQSDPSFRWNTAAAHRNSAVAETSLGHYGSAHEHLGQARRLNAELGLMIEVATCDFWEAVVTVGESDDDGLRRALDLGIPAMLLIDAQRFQYPHAASRIAWAALNAQIRGALFDWAHRLGDADLMADLIEVSVNAGMHVAAHRPESAGSELFAPLAHALDADLAPLSGPAKRPATTTIRPIGGAAALISGAMLPMRPSPKLLMPDGRVALAPYLDSAIRRYGAADRPYTVQTW
ncbi:tetratricopeptide repeat protein [Nocardia sp. SYP-A9097]|uniref:tetratricopeptide repeat protein n=1 Tax=Nocardia sp. SYP-A9097 TaxID=2663237 RepID=UPI00129A63FF|nr:tetratricopeptide repeat protein [Nocardia sp. SYP-A9097]MRH91687.1 tetratricopeptide repeat protein [Nocardia sp. SYP-A9097]